MFPRLQRLVTKYINSITSSIISSPDQIFYCHALCPNFGWYSSAKLMYILYLLTLSNTVTYSSYIVRTASSYISHPSTILCSTLPFSAPSPPKNYLVIGVPSHTALSALYLNSLVWTLFVPYNHPYKYSTAAVTSYTTVGTSRRARFG